MKKPPIFFQSSNGSSRSNQLLPLLSLLPLFFTACLSETVADPASINGLPANHPPVSGAAPVVDSKLAVTTVSYQLGGRKFIISALQNVFLSSNTTSANVSAFQTILNQTIETAPQVFGDALNLYSTVGLKETTDGVSRGLGSMSNDDDDKIAPHVDSTPARTAILGEACRRITGNDVFLLEALNKIGLTSPSNGEVNPTLINSLLQLYSPGYVPSLGMLNAYMAVAQAALSTGTPLANLETWRLLADVACEDPYWQAL